MFTILYQSNKPPISTSSSGSSTLAGAYWAGLSSTFAATVAWVGAGAFDYLIWSNINPDYNPIAAKSLNALTNKYGAEASLTQPIDIIYIIYYH